MAGSVRLCSQQGLTQWKMAMSLFQTCHLLFEGWWCFSHLKNPQFVLVFVNNWSRLRAENCQLLDLMAVVATEVVMSAQTSNVIWDAELIV